MRAPAFWWTRPPSLLARSLAPAGMVYGGITAWRMHRRGTDPGVPVLCVGNLVAGGAGKTPATVALARLLQAEGRSPAVLSRGYGRIDPRHAPPVLRVDPARHTAAETGDEPLLIARVAPTLVGADRRVTARAAVAEGADVLLLDDGLQNPALAKSWTLAVADGVSGIGNGLCVPAGPLRAPLPLQWPAVSMLCVVGPGGAGLGLANHAARFGVPVITARLVPDPDTIARWRGRRLFAFAGIGRPTKFFDTLREKGLDLGGTRAFPDHHVFTAADLRRLREEAGADALVTTEKDRVRFPPDPSIEALPVRLVFDDPGVILAALAGFSP